MNTIYALADPETTEIRYIGATLHYSTRIASHKCNSSNKGVAEWVADLKDKGMVPVVTVLENGVSNELVGEVEERWIRQALDQGARLFNVRRQGKPKPKAKDSLKWLHLKNVPPALHLAIKLKAISQGMTIQDFVIDIMQKEVANGT